MEQSGDEMEEKNKSKGQGEEVLTKILILFYMKFFR